MEVCYQIPAKTFIAGEYLALLSGPSLVLTSQPAFEFRAWVEESSFFEILFAETKFHPKSPAGLLLENKFSFLKTLKNRIILNFKDPYQGAGGFGASSAQFVALAHFLTALEQSRRPDAFEVYDLYRSILANQSKAQVLATGHEQNSILPSGVDVLAQQNSGIVFVDTKNKILQKKSWGFQKASMMIFKTPDKIATHEHLADSNQYIHKIEEHEALLTSLVQQASDSLEHQNLYAFCDAVQTYSNILVELGLITESSLELIQKIRSLPIKEHIYVVKACGAMGADVLMLVCDSIVKEVLYHQAIHMGLKYIADESQIFLGDQL